MDVITGLISEYSNAVAFKFHPELIHVRFSINGAEQLLGNGDMLYLPPGTGVPVRVHGAFVADDEVHRVVAAWQTYGKPIILRMTEAGAKKQVQPKGAG